MKCLSKSLENLNTKSEIFFSNKSTLNHSTPPARWKSTSDIYTSIEPDTGYDSFNGGMC